MKSIKTYKINLMFMNKVKNLQNIQEQLKNLMVIKMIKYKKHKKTIINLEKLYIIMSIRIINK